MDFTQLKLQWLWYFIDVAKTKNFSKTAERNYTSQPNVSYSIKSLEREIGVPLFVRKDTEIILSTYGEMFLPFVTEAFEKLSDGCKVIDDSVNPLSGEVKIGFSYIFSLAMIPDLFRFLYLHFGQHGLPINLNTTMVHVNDDISCVEDIILNGTCSLGITCVQARRGCSYKLITRQELALLLPNNHPLAHKERLSLLDVKDEPFILLNGDVDLLGYYEHLFEYYQITPNLINPGLDWLSILVQVAAGRCLTIAPKGRYSNYDVTLVTLDHPMKMRDVYLTWLTKRKLNKATLHTRDLIIDYFQNQEPADY